MKMFRMAGMFKMIHVLDWLVLLSLSYGTSTDLEEEQELFFKVHNIDKMEGENYLEHPLGNIPKRAILNLEER